MTLKKLETFKKRLAQQIEVLDPTLQSNQWAELKQEIENCHYSTEVLLEYLPPELTLVILLALPDDQVLKLLFGELLKKTLSTRSIQLLKNFTAEKLYQALTPYLYLSDARGARAVYLCAELGITLNKDCYAHLLSSRKWTRDDLLNLVFLVQPDQRNELITDLDNEKKKDLAVITAVTFDEFSHLLLQGIMASPVAPQLADIAYKQPDLNKIENLLQAQNSEQSDIWGAAEQASKAVRPSLAQLQQHNSHKSGATKGSRQDTPKGQTVATPAYTNLILVGLCAIAIISFISWVFAPSVGQITTKSANPRLPESWTDAATNRPVTHAFLRADKDYRMGELYLTRDRYAEALQMFEDALSVDSTHASALFRAGFCRMMLDDLPGARSRFEQLLKQHHNFKNANLYLARIAIKNNNHEQAIHHYELEFANAIEPNIGLEYAAFLDSINNTEKAGMVINRLQQQFPQRVLISTSGNLRQPDMGRQTDE